MSKAVAGEWLWGLTEQTPKPLPLLLAPGPAEQALWTSLSHLQTVEDMVLTFPC